MKNLITVLALSLITILAKAQTINQTIDFNTYSSATNNDLANNFHGGFSLTQVTTGGITGGALNIPPGSTSEAIYNKPLKITSTPTTASICFRFSHALYTSGNGGGYGASLKFLDAGGGYIEFTATVNNIAIHDYTVSVYSSSYLNGSQLSDNHWYQLKGQLSTNNSNPALRLHASIYLYDIGTSGTSTPILVTSRVNDTIPNFIGPTYTMQLGVYGEQRAGVQYLDNLNIAGLVAAGITDQELDAKILVPTIIPASVLSIRSTLNKAVSFQLFSESGVCLKTGTIFSQEDIDCSTFSSGNYFLKLNDENSYAVKRLVKY